jgi:hypothetical protein
MDPTHLLAMPVCGQFDSGVTGENSEKHRLIYSLRFYFPLIVYV